MWRVEGAMEGGCVTGAQGMRAGTQLQSDPMECWEAPCMSWGSVSLPPSALQLSGPGPGEVLWTSTSTKVVL